MSCGQAEGEGACFKLGGGWPHLSQLCVATWVLYSNYALLHSRSCPRRLTPDLFLLFRDVSRCCMVISQVTVSFN